MGLDEKDVPSWGFFFFHFNDFFGFTGVSKLGLKYLAIKRSGCTGPPNLHAQFRHRLDDKLSATQTGFIVGSLRDSDVVWQFDEKE